MIRRVQTYLPFFVAFVLVQALLGHVWPDTLWLTSFATFLVAILLEAVPFVLIGSLVSGAIEVFVPREIIAQWVPRNRFRAVMLFGLLGIVFPICECGIVPVIRRLLRKGVPLSCGVTYLLAAPIVQPIVFISTLVAFNGSWKIAVLRVLGGYLVAITVGAVSVVVLDPRTTKALAFSLASAEPESTPATDSHALHEDCGSQTDEGPILGMQQTPQAATPCCTPGCGHNHGDATLQHKPLRIKVDHVLRNAAEDFVGTGSYLIFGAFLAAAMQTFVSQDALARLGHGPILGPLVMMAVAFSLSLCSTADAFVAAAFSQFSLPARMAFMVMGPMVDIKLLAMYNGFLSRKSTAFVFGLATVLAFLYAMLLHGWRL